MKSQILKIAGVKSEKEFYKKYPSEEAFMKQHGKAFKKAQIGTLVGGQAPHQSVSKPASFINFQELYDESDKLINGSTEAERQKAAYDQALLNATGAANQAGNNSNAGGLGGVLSNTGSMLNMLGGAEGAGGDAEMAAMAARYGTNVPRAYNGTNANNWWSGMTTTAQSTYPPNIANTYGISAQTMGVTGGGNAPVNQPGTQGSYGFGGTNYAGPPGAYGPNTSDPNWMNKSNSTIPQVGAANIPSGKTSSPKEDSAFNQAMKALGPFAGPLGTIGEGISDINAERHAKWDAQRDEKVSEVARVASATREEQSKRRYVRPEDIQNTGEEFFPIYGVGTNPITRNGGHFHRAQDGDEIGGNDTEIQNTYSGYEPLYNPFEVKDFRQGGYLHRAQTGWQNYQNSLSGGGKGFSGAGENGTTPWGSISNVATGATQSAMGGQNGGGKVGQASGQLIGSMFGPLGGAIGGFVGGVAGNLLDTNGRDMKKAQAKTNANTQVMALNSGFQGLEGTYNRYVRNGGDIHSYEDGGYMNPNYNPQVITMFGDHNSDDFADYANKYRAGGHLREYTPPSERAMETYEDGGEITSYAMGGQLKTHWGGKAETISHNPYMPGSGETVLFKGQSHTQSDKEGNTGIGITYGENPVEVERGEPMFEMGAGGEVNPQTGEAENTGVVFGNMQIDKKVASQLNDPDLMEIANKFHGKKFKNIGIDLSKQEAKQNKIIEKNTDLLSSFKVETSLDKAKFLAMKANMEGADAKLRNIANTKITLANYQNAINDAKEELSDVIGQNLSAEDLAKGYTKLDKDPVTMDAKWGGNIVKRAQNGDNTSKTKSFKSAREAAAAGYHKGADGKYHRTIKKFSTKDTETKSASAMDNIPIQKVDKTTGLGEITPAQFEAFKKKNSWYDWSKFDPKNPDSVNDYAQKFNAEAVKRGSTARILPDDKNTGKVKYVGKQFISADLGDEKKTDPANSEEELTAIVDEPTSPATPEQKPNYPWMPYANQALRYLQPTDQTALDSEQLYPEWYAMASNQVEPVPAQSYQPELIVPYDISLQAQRNAIISGQRAVEKQLGYNPAAQANAAPAGYNAINEINEKEFIANQGEHQQVYNANINTMNDAKKINLGIFADQWTKQSQARSNTKATTQAALNSIADKYAKHKLENRKLSIYENMYNYRFGQNGKAKNYNGLQFFDTTVGGKGSSDKSGALASGKEFTYDAAGNIVGVRASDKDTVDDSALEAVGGIKDKNGGAHKKNYKNSSVVRAFKNL